MWRVVSSGEWVLVLHAIDCNVEFVVFCFTILISSLMWRVVSFLEYVLVLYAIVS